MYSILLDQAATVWAEPNIVLSMVKRRLINLPQAQINDLAFRIGSWNMEYMWQAKAEHFLDTYREIISRHHILAAQEVTPPALATIAKTCNYNFAASQPNSRGQAVGLLIHPRLLIQNIYEYPQLTNICGVPDLRPALRADLFDCQSQLTFSIVTVHLKSMLGHMPFTSHVRRQQLRQLVISLADNKNPTIILGDFNCFLDTSGDIDCLLTDGYRLTNPHNHTSTQSCGGRLDGLFHKNLPPGFKPGSYNIRDFWRSSLSGRSLSDHGLLTWKMPVGV